MDSQNASDNRVSFIDWNEDGALVNNISNFLEFSSPHTGLHDANSTPKSSILGSFQSQNVEDPVTELAAVPNPPVVGFVVGTPNQVQIQTTDPSSSYQGSSSNSSGHQSFVASAFVPENPNPLPLPLPNSSAPPLNQTQPSHPLPSSAMGLAWEGGVNSSIMTQKGYFNQLSNMQNENSLRFQGLGVSDEYPTTGNNPPLVPNTIQNNNFSGNNNQTSPYQALFHPNSAQARPGIESGNSRSQMLIGSARNSRPEQDQLSAPNVHGSQYAPNYTQSAQSFTTLQNQVGHASGTQDNFDLQSQNSKQPVNPIYPRSELYSSSSDLQSGFGTMPSNSYQQGYSPVVPGSAAPSPSSASSLTPTHSQLFEKQDHQHNERDSESSKWYRGVQDRINEYNRMISNPSLQRPSSTLHEHRVQSSSFSNSLSLSSARILGLSSTRASEGTSPQVPIKEVENERLLRAPPSEAMQRILEMNPSRIINRNGIAAQLKQRGSLQNGRGSRNHDFRKQLLTLKEGYQPPRRGRPPKRRDVGESSSSQRGKKVSTGAGKADQRNPIPQEPPKTNPEIAVNRDLQIQNDDIPINPDAELSEHENLVYNIKYEKRGYPIDPHIRLFKASQGKYCA
ncbi:uncharacterized protein LOC109810792 [Cajanus cajan]|uniref:uncharacterized protein LOC109810792 n=1 Tax=Cajanus cajan TaxID=3821 RepID=UPI00098DB47D|nr:uncharacterized protein LOC109810792 [Cajanus cajan]XP_029129690.1 uncharacterized protein LOC109810792 [Cajanus cajan]